MLLSSTVIIVVPQLLKARKQRIARSCQILILFVLLSTRRAIETIDTLLLMRLTKNKTSIFNLRYSTAMPSMIVWYYKFLEYIFHINP